MGPYEYKGLIMAEHENGCWTNHHSIVNYKGQWYLFYHHNAFSPDFDKNRSAQIERLYFNEDGTIQEVKPTLRGVGPVKATQKVHIDRYSEINGAEIQYIDTTDYFQGWKTVFTKSGDQVTFNGLDFGNKAPKNVIIKAKGNSDSNSTIQLTAGEKTVDLELAVSEQWNEIKIRIKEKITGVQDLKVELIAGDGVEIDWITFK